MHPPKFYTQVSTSCLYDCRYTIKDHIYASVGMVKTRSMTRNQNHDDDDVSSSSCRRKRFKTFDNSDVAPWSDLNHHLLFLVMKQLGVVDFIAFSGVCKSWRSYALSNKDWFMASRLPMSISIDPRSNNKDSYCYLEDSEGRSFKTILPHSAGRGRYGLTCGYLILYGWETRSFLLVNPITRHELHFPDYPLSVGAHEEEIKGILVFSPLISRFVFVVLHRKPLCYVTGKPKILYYIEGKRRWNPVSSRDTLPIVDLHVFNGKIYTLHTNCTLCELRLNLNQKHNWTLLETKTLPNPDFSTTPRLVSSNEDLFVISRYSSPKKALELDFGEMKWVSPEKTIGEYAFFISGFNSCAAIKPESWADPQTRYKCYGYFRDDDRNQQCIYYYERMWYFPHDCLNVSVLDD